MKFRHLPLFCFLSSDGVGGSGGRPNVVTSEHLSLAKRLTTMEMKELNERQRAEHAVRIQDQLRKTLTEMENRNLELEQKFAEVSEKRQ